MPIFFKSSRLPDVTANEDLTEAIDILKKNTFFGYDTQDEKPIEVTQSNLQILLLHKAGLNNQETAQIIGVRIDGVNKAK